MPDLYPLEDVLEQPANNSSADQSAEQLLAKLMAFNPDAEKALGTWTTAAITTPPTATDISVDWQGLLAEALISLLCGDTDQVRLEALDTWLHNCPLREASVVRSAIALFGHRPAKALKLYNATGNSANSTIEGLPALCHALALIQQTAQSLSCSRADQFNDADRAQLNTLHAALNHLSREYQQRYAGDRFIPVLKVLVDFVRVLSGERKLKDTLWLGGIHIDASPWLDLFIGLSRHWLGEKPDEKQIERLAAHVDNASDIGMHWFVDEALSLISILGLQRQDKEFQPQIRSVGWLINIFQIESDWQGALEALTLTANRHTRLNRQHTPLTGNRRLGWWIEAHGSKLLVEPKEQRLSKDGQWIPGKHFPLKLLLDECGTLDFLCDHDLKICAQLRNQIQLNHALNFEHSFTFDTAESLDLLIGHPRLYRHNNDTDDTLPARVTVQLENPALHIVKDTAMQEITVTMQPYPEGGIHTASDFSCYWKNQHTLIIHRFSEGQLDIAHSLSFNGLCIPEDGSNAVLDSLRSLASIAEIHSDLTDVNSDSVAPLCKPVFHLYPLDQGIYLECRIYPLGESGPCVIPGRGKPGIHASVDRQPRNTIRDLNKELGETQDVLAQLPLTPPGSQWIWTVDSSLDALELLAALQKLGNRISLLWPTSEPIALSKEVSSDCMHVHFNPQRPGIAISGELKFSDDQADQPESAAAACPFSEKKIDLKKLLAAIEKAEGRFLRLDNGRILQLSQRLKKQLLALNALAEDGMAHDLSVPVLTEVSRGMVLQDDDGWDDQCRRFHEAQSMQPMPPTTLKASLRDYQLEGFQWMARLAHWGAGACLADDMGLGKTMQSLALMLTRAADGPALVVAPTSVCGNWLAEAAKFAPSLNLRWLGDKNRHQMLLDAKPYDLFVCSYGVMQNEVDSLREIHWRTIVADEAQTFKNPGTGRSRAIMSLQSDFRMIATGTPIENHLGELWNLFRFINPGLLGNSQTFKEKYATPIELHENDEVRQQLKAVIKPFILRRLKREVLTELPPRTEITHLIEFNQQQRDFYESLRQNAMQRIGELAGLESEQRFKVLAEITKLRQASCHPALAVEHPPCDSAKLNAFSDKVSELRKNGHRCLVFSQFVGHLKLIREHLDAKRIRYQYLDGTTPAKQRTAAVDAFQAGEGELFLISLKAGNSGLNLTAADYVIHMDPWWNPAVEDQASDRAYRMGQKKPVTIYRMIIKDTIEEKIVNLHQQKRDLANALLEGTDNGSRLSVEELVALIADEEN